jgi:hypothetical protein
MHEYTVMAYNIENMNRLFDIQTNTIKENNQERAQKIAHVIKEINPHVLGICEAASAPEEHEHFIRTYLEDSGYQLAQNMSRGHQNLVFYYRHPFSVVSIDDEISFYEPWKDDIDEDTLDELYTWDRIPLEVEFRIGEGDSRLRIILVHAKYKGVFDVVDLHNYQKIALANRKRLVGQALNLRERLNQLLEDSHLPIMVIGDMNDGPGLDPYEKMVGKSFVETVMGSVYEPQNIFYNVLWNPDKKRIWTASFRDPIVSSPYGKKHYVWIDHILVSPCMLKKGSNSNSSVSYVDDSGKVRYDIDGSQEASDHFPVLCTVEKQG